MHANDKHKEFTVKIIVPDGDYCSGQDDDYYFTCQYFDNEGGHGHCSIRNVVGCGDIKMTSKGYLKSSPCKALTS